MCGITGFITKEKMFSEHDLLGMTHSLDHRGPDNSGTYVSQNGKVGLGHTRLSILDLSQAANQPFYSHCGRYVMVYNGEVYNYKSIAQELGIELKTSCDSEVIIEAFKICGEKFVNKLNGMFSIVIYDIHAKKGFFFRDRLGIKPLYIYQNKEEGIILFASELKSLLNFSDILKFDIDYTSVTEFLHLGYIPEPRTIYSSISKFPAGSLAVLTNDFEFKISAYWSINGSVTKNVISDFKSAESILDSLIHSSVKKRLISDVPFGTFLSGGIDSSLITAIANEHVVGSLNTFSIGFKEKSNDERIYARQVAKHLDTNHHEFLLSMDDAKAMLTDFINAYDEPFSDSSGIPTMLVSKMAKEKVSVVLSGDGGDELFHGYGMYDWAERLPYFSESNKKIFKYMLGRGSSRMRRASTLFNSVKKSNLRSHIFSQEQYLFSENEIYNVLQVDNKNVIKYEDHIYDRVLSPKELQALYDLQYYLKDDLLVKVDRASMKYGLEVRIPLLDHEIVEFALNLSPTLKTKGKEKKLLLKKVLYNYVPPSYFDRPKSGFNIPLQDWLSNDLKYLLDEYLNEDLIHEIGILDVDVVNEYKRKFLGKEKYLYNRIWCLILLMQFLKKHQKI